MFEYEYPRPALTVDAVVFCIKSGEINVLLIERKNNPYKDCWALPGGFVDIDELIDKAVLRELEEETCLKNVELKRLNVYDAIDRDPRGRTISVVYYGQVDESNSIVKGEDDAKQAKWFSIKSLPSLAFDHEIVLKDAIKAFKTK
ncbi:NUDIX hydrolase [Marinilabiliaceae bacterium JC040]|nr:NUDIX hydrolase [Marinilabiliaceae bacterium JC040]